MNNDTPTPPEYTYGGQWFDDMGALALAFQGSPSVGIDIARSGLSRAQSNDLAKNLMRSGVPGYADQGESPVDKIGA